LSNEVEEYTEVEAFLRGVEDAVKSRPAWDSAGGRDEGEYRQSDQGS
jgi:hypothetical protein